MTDGGGDESQGSRVEFGSHGRLGRFGLSVDPRLSRASVPDLASALTAALSREPAHASYSGGMRRHAALEALFDALPAALEEPSNRFSIQLASSQIRFLAHGARRFGVPIEGATHVDLGCGSLNPYGRMFTHQMLGVGEARCFELDPPQDHKKAIRHLHRLFCAAWTDPQGFFHDASVSSESIWRHVSDFDWKRVARGEQEGIPERLSLSQRGIEQTGLAAGSVDVTFSNSVLEHVEVPDAVLEEIARITKPGGFGLHGIDFTDHRRYGDPTVHPMEFLADPSTSRIVHGCNRWRVSDFRAAFERHGFELLETWGVPSCPMPLHFRERLAPTWKVRPEEDLTCPWLQWIWRRK